MNQDELIKQNKMFKELVAALEKQNNTRNMEKDVLLRQIDRLTAENDSLRAQPSRPNNNYINQNEMQMALASKRQIQQKLRVAQNNYRTAINQQIQYKNENTKLKVQIQNLNNRQKSIQVTTSSTSNINQLNQLKFQNDQLKRKVNHLQKKQSELNRLQNENRQLKSKNNQMSNRQIIQSRQYQNKLNQFKRVEGQKIRQTIKSQFDTQKQRQIDNMRTNYNVTLQKKDQTIRQLENKLNQVQIKNYDTDKNSSAQMSQLRITKSELDRKISLVQQQKNRMQKKIQQLKQEISHKNAIIVSSKVENSSLQNMRNLVNKRQQQISRSNSIVQALKQNVFILQKRVQQYQISIERLKAQQSNRKKNAQNLKRQQLSSIKQKYQKQVQQLKSKIMIQQNSFPHLINEQKRYSTEKQRENEQLKKILQQLSQNNRQLIQKLKNVESYQQKQKIDNQYQKSRTNKSAGKGEYENELRSVIQQLRQELKDVRSDFKRIQDDNKKMGNMISSKVLQSSNGRDNSYREVAGAYAPLINSSLMKESGHGQRRNININYTQPISPKQQVSPKFAYQNQMFIRPETVDEPKVRYSKLREPQIIGSQLSPKPLQKDKWQMLQKRINQLRQENDELKHSLYS